MEVWNLFNKLGLFISALTDFPSWPGFPGSPGDPWNYKSHITNVNKVDFTKHISSMLVPSFFLLSLLPFQVASQTHIWSIPSFFSSVSSVSFITFLSHETLQDTLKWTFFFFFDSRTKSIFILIKFKSYSVSFGSWWSRCSWLPLLSCYPWRTPGSRRTNQHRISRFSLEHNILNVPFELDFCRNIHSMISNTDKGRLPFDPEDRQALIGQFFPLI